MNEELRERAISHWEKAANLEALVNSLRADGLDLTSLKPPDLYPYDQLHMGGVDITRQVAEAAGMVKGLRVLDVGSGWGGPARLLAHEYGCQVQGIDLTPVFVQGAQELTRMVGLEEKVLFERGDGERFPVPSSAFDVAWVQHCAMCIPDKHRLYQECARVLVTSGRLVMHDWARGTGPEPLYPLRWADTPASSFTPTLQQHLQQTEAAGFRLHLLERLNEDGLVFFQRRVEQSQQKLAQSRDEKTAQELRESIERDRRMLRNLKEDRLVCYLYVGRLS